MKNLVILISGRGSNMEAIVRACVRESWPARVAAVISNRPEAAGLGFAASQGIATAVVDHRQFSGRAAFDAALAHEIERFAPDLVVLAGFMRVLTDAFVTRYAGRLLNIHPSLLPGFTGLNTHQRALDAGVRLHGASVHFVTPELDHGPIVAQAAVPVRDGDDAVTLAARVLAAEHVLYPRAVRWFVEDRLVVDGLRVRLEPRGSAFIPSATETETQWLFIDDTADAAGGEAAETVGAVGSVKAGAKSDGGGGLRDRGDAAGYAKASAKADAKRSTKVSTKVGTKISAKMNANACAPTRAQASMEVDAQICIKADAKTSAKTDAKTGAQIDVKTGVKAATKATKPTVKPTAKTGNTAQTTETHA